MPYRKATALALAWLFLACSPERETPATPKTAESSAPRDGGTLLRRLEGDIATLNYLLQTSDYERWVLQYLYDPLIDVDRNLQPVAAAAKSWDVSPDGLTYTLHLDPNGTFSDGKPVRASDVVFTLKKMVQEQSPQFSGFFEGLDLEKTVAVDDQTVRVVFTTPRAGRWYAFNVGVLPEHVYGKGDFKTAFNETVVGNGAYRLVRRDVGKSIELERRPDYKGQRPHIDKVLFKVITDAGTAWNAAKTGAIDEMRITPDAFAAEKDRAEVKARLNFYDAYPLMYNCIAWNNRDPIVSDVRVRRALSRAYDRQSVITHLYKGQARPISGPFTPDQWAYNASVPADTYDLKAAARLLDEAGWRDTNGDGVRDKSGRKMSINMSIASTDARAKEQSQLLQNALSQIGVEMKISARDGAALFGAIMEGNYQGAFMAWSLDPDPDVSPLFHSKAQPPAGLNLVRYSNPEADRLMDACQIERDPAKRRELFHQLHALLASEQPYTWTIQPMQKWAVNQRVKNAEISKGWGLYSWRPGPLAWWLAQ